MLIGPEVAGQAAEVSLPSPALSRDRGARPRREQPGRRQAGALPHSRWLHGVGNKVPGVGEGTGGQKRAGGRVPKRPAHQKHRLRTA